MCGKLRSVAALREWEEHHCELGDGSPAEGPDARPGGNGTKRLQGPPEGPARNLGKTGVRQEAEREHPNLLFGRLPTRSGHGHFLGHTTLNLHLLHTIMGPGEEYTSSRL